MPYRTSLADAMRQDLESGGRGGFEVIVQSTGIYDLDDIRSVKRDSLEVCMNLE